MTDLRQAAQQALEAWDGGDTEWFKRAYTVMDNLRAALAQQAEPVEPVAWANIDSDRLRVDPATGNVSIGAQQAEPGEPVQQPYCYVYEYDGAFGLHREFYPKVYNGHKPDRTVPVYTAPPQRLPLTEGVLMGVYIDFDRTADPAWSRAEYLLRLFRAVERAHGIKE